MVSAVCGVMMQWREIPERMVVGQGLRIGHIERSSGNGAVPQSLDQRIGVDVPAAGHIDEPGRLLHEAELLQPR